LVFFGPPEREQVVEEAPLPDGWEHAATATAEGSFEGIDSRDRFQGSVPAEERWRNADRTATAAAPDVAEVVEDVSPVEKDVAACDELAPVATATSARATEPAPPPGLANPAPAEAPPTGTGEELAMATAASGDGSPGAPVLRLDRSSAFLQNKANFPANHNRNKDLTSTPKPKRGPGRKGRKGLQGKETVGVVPLPAAFLPSVSARIYREGKPQNVIQYQSRRDARFSRINQALN
jgi:hypothetical protein